MEHIKHYLERNGINTAAEIIYNPSYERIFQEEMDPNNTGFAKGSLTTSGAVSVKTGIFTGRSPKDRFIVKDQTTENTIWWDGKINLPTTTEIFNELKGLVTKDLSNQKLFVVDTFCGTNPDTRLKVRFVTKVAWQAHFVMNMFIRPSHYDLANYGEPDF